MRMRNAMATALHWIAFSGALAMVGFLTFVPQRTDVLTPPARIVPHQTSMEWPPHKAAMTATLR